MSDEDVVSASEAGHTSEGVSDLTMTTYKETSSIDPALKIARCKVSSLLIGVRCSLSVLADSEADDIETDYFYFINGIRAREKKGIGITDVTAFDQLDGVVANQEPIKMQQSMVNFFTDEVRNYLSINSDIITCSGTHQSLMEKITTRLNLVRQFKSAVDELSLEIPNHSEMYDFVKLKKEIYSAFVDLTRKFALLKCVEEPILNLHQNDNLNQMKHILKMVAVDVSIALENIDIPDNWTKSQFFQVMCEEIMERSSKMVKVDKIFVDKSSDATTTVLNAMKLCTAWKRMNEYTFNLCKTEFDMELEDSNMFASIQAFIRRCKDLLEICYSNSQLYSTFSGSEDSGMIKEAQLDQIYLEYSKLLSKISQVRHQSLDIKNESLGSYFVQFRSEMHIIDTMILSSIKASFEGVTNIKEMCETLDTFYSMSERSRVKDAYFQRAKTVTTILDEEIMRLTNDRQQRLAYTKLFYSNYTVNFVRAHGLIQRSNSIVEDVTGSNFFLSDTHKLRSFRKNLEPLRENLDKLLDGAKKNRHYLERLEVSYKSFLICRSAGNDSTLDICINRDLPSAPFETRLLESLGLSIISARSALFERFNMHQLNVALVSRMILEYNMIFASRLSSQERGLFRSKILLLDRRIWSGIYARTWQEQQGIGQWATMCEETIWNLCREVNSYKAINFHIDKLLIDLRQLEFVRVNEFYEYEPETFCKEQYIQMNLQIDTIRARCALLLSQMKRIKSLLEIDEANDQNQQWQRYRTAIASCLGEAIVFSLAQSMKKLAEIIHDCKTRPVARATLALNDNKILCLSPVGKDLLLFLDAYKTTATSVILSAIVDRTWSEVINRCIDENIEIKVVNEVIQLEIEETFSNVQKYLSTLNPLKDFWTLMPEGVLNYYQKECGQVEAFVKDLAKLKDVSFAALKFPKKKWINFICIDAAEFLTNVAEYCVEWRKEFISILDQLAKQYLAEAELLLSELKACITWGHIRGREDYMDNTLTRIEKKALDTSKLLALLNTNGVDVSETQEAVKNLQAQHFVLKRDRNNILLQTMDASQKIAEQQRRAKEITKNLEDQITSYRVQAPFTSTWKSEEALTEIENFQQRLEGIKVEVATHEVEKFIEGYHAKVKELAENLMTLLNIWTVVNEWEKFEKKFQGQKVMDLNLKGFERELKSLQEKISAFSSGIIDSRIEIHLTVQNRQAIYEGNLTLIEAFRSEAIKPRHWILISKTCGFQTNVSSQGFIENMTLEEFMALNLDKQVIEIKCIIDNACLEFRVEENLEAITHTLSDLGFKYKTNSSGIRVIVNDAQVQDFIQNILKNLSQFKESEASAPFAPQIESLEVRLNETTKKINLLKKVESSFNIMSEVSSSYSLDLQLGKFKQKLDILFEVWRNVHQDISEHVDIVSAMNDESLEGTLWAFEQEMTSLEELLVSFLKTRKEVFPQFALIPDQKLKLIFCSRTTENINNWARTVFPQVQKLVFSKKETDKPQILGFITQSGIQKPLLAPLLLDNTTDFIACKLQAALQASFKEEIYQNFLGLKKVAQTQKQERYPMYSMQVLFVTRMIGLCTDLQKVMSESKFAQKQQSLDMLVQHNNRISTLLTLIQECKVEESCQKYYDAMDVEVSMKQRLEYFIKLIFSKEENTAQIRQIWGAILKYTAREPFELNISIHDKIIPYGYDESNRCDALLMHCYMDKTLNQIGKLFTNNFGSVLNGKVSSGRLTAVKCFAQFLGRHCIALAQFPFSNLGRLESLLFAMEAAQDIICFKNIEQNKTYNNIYHAVLGFYIKVREYKSCMWNRTSPGLMADETLKSRLFYITSFSKKMATFIGKDYRLISLVRIDMPFFIHFALLAEGYNVTFELIQLIYILLKITEEKSQQPIAFSFHDVRNLVRYATSKINRLNASTNEAVVASILERFHVNRKLVSSIVKMVDQRCFFNKVVENVIPEKQIEFCKQNHLEVTPHFRKMMSDVTYTLNSKNHALLYGGPASLKSSIWKASASIMDFEILTISTLAVDNHADASDAISTLATAPRGKSRDLLLVIEGPIDDVLTNSFLALNEHDSLVVRTDGQLQGRERRLKLIIETDSISSLAPSSISYFKLHKCENVDVQWQKILKNKMAAVIQDCVILDPRRQSYLLKGATKYAEYFLEARKAVGFESDSFTQFMQLTSLTGFVASVLNDGIQKVDEDDIDQIIIFGCVFCFSQDIPVSVKSKFEIKIRELYECRNIPVEFAVFDYFYDAPSKTWKPFRSHPSYISLERSKKILLHNHARQEIVARTILKNLVSIDIRGTPGAGKSTLLSNLLKSFGTPDFLGVSVPSCSGGVSLCKITNSIIRCLKRNDNSTDNGKEQATNSASRKNFLFCIDDVDASDNSFPLFIKFFTERRTWLAADTGVVHYPNQVLATTRKFVGNRGPHFHSVIIRVDEIESFELTNLFKISLKERFLQFELDIQFLITKVIMASVDINKVFMDLNLGYHVNRFHIQDNMKIISGLMHAHKDCHDTKYELLELWVNEIYRTYFEKLSVTELDAGLNKVTDVMMYYFGEDAKTLLNTAKTTLLGDFLDPYQFYTVIEMDDIREFIITKAIEVNEKMDKKLEIVCCKNTLMQACRLMLTTEIPGGHLIMYGTAVVCPRSITELVCKIRGIRFFGLTQSDVSEDRWRKKFRTISKLSGVEKRPTCLFVSLDIFNRIGDVRSCLESFINLGYDLSLFEVDELEIICQKSGYLSELSANTRHHFHCVVSGQSFEEVESHFSNDNFHVSDCGDFEENLDAYAEELLYGSSNLDPSLFGKLHKKAKEFFDNRHVKEDSIDLKPDLSSYVKFIRIYRRYVDLSLSEYDTVLEKIGVIESLVGKHFAFSETESDALIRKKETSKSYATEHQNITVSHIQTKKELVEIEALAAETMNDYADERASVLRLNMAIVEERTCQWSLFQRALRDFDDALMDDLNNDEFLLLKESSNPVSMYIKHLQKVVRNEDDEDFCIKLKFIFSEVLKDYDVKSIVHIGEDETLRTLREGLTSEDSDSSVILSTIVKLHSRTEVMAKSLKNTQVKEQKLGVLQRKCQSIEDKLQDLRKQKKDLHTRLLNEQRNIEELQSNIGLQNEAINALEQVTSEHKNLKDPLTSFMEFLEQMNILMNEEKSKLPGSVILGAAFCGYCGSLTNTERLDLIREWKLILREAGVRFNEDFIPFIMTGFLRSNISDSEPLSVKQNIALLSTLQDPITIVDPKQISLEYIELVHVMEKVSLLHIGDPDFKKQFSAEAKESKVIAILHSTLDLGAFAAMIDLSKVKLVNRDLLIYHVSPALPESEKIMSSPSRIIFFDVEGQDSVSYVHNHLQLLTPEKSNEDRRIIATDRDRIEVEIDPYVMDETMIMDLNKITNSVERIKRIIDGAKSNLAKGRSVSMSATGGADLLLKYSTILTEAYNAVSSCPFTKTIPVSMQMCLTTSKKILDGFEMADKKELTQERMSMIVADTIIRIYDTNLSKYDGLALKTCLVFYLFKLSRGRSAVAALENALSELLVSKKTRIERFSVFLRELVSESKTSDAVVGILKCLITDFSQFEKTAESFLSKVLPQKINCDKDLHRIYSKSSRDTPSVIVIDSDVSFLEALFKFSENFQIEDFLVINMTDNKMSQIRLVLEAMDKPAWVVFIGVQRESANLVDFMISQLKMCKTVNENFRFWIVCQEVQVFNLPTAQKCVVHYLGHEDDPALKDPEDQEESTLEGIDDLMQFRIRLQAMAERNEHVLKRSKLYLKQNLVEALHQIITDFIS